MKLGILLAAMALALLVAGCGIHTRAAIKNESGGTITVALGKAGAAVQYKAIAAGTTSAYQSLSLDEWTHVLLTINAEGAPERTLHVPLTPEHDNTVTVTRQNARSSSTYNKENEWW
ncbi:MAG: hypothetical protein ACI9WU_000332 [Myxococcota bacterium]|jgi:hypothetical protein